ncbi:MAG: hypothetical protein A3F82_10355 [Deltaproteobacteria bacterium RIFCSPLOWO2_12_FULL_44_12]|nr:MAG: hypothetical protein A2712_07715 [Deltaproteobacteria bacterium RIFCSPHIGHO2_01_FULL_43_49]OGQ14771.1 MAG: hypothetical protein A3D22_09280 [Deltaproteobacteria bacterium RIFCSPHIGHO2_02_FULL_44_53]OGQ28157.1 MAG: hypothetical protein A3D98_07990 [Deltaproteobacteria bacterium RIFCSPHIGHO2_12_FULL_44_21]OGQ31369.1 MAG: hypothetical protein A2979_08040 [Deltaproteobacteria bacterium RIFCSPLOWO2_01_FULL_45_74]OGQ43361.1 MAG: hypothetical protein A3I70_01700 [Deltaproteobacteria bacterium 
MQIHYTPHFVKGLKKLPQKVQELAIRQEEIFRKNPQDPRLHIKILKGRLAGLSSFRVTRNYRVLFAKKEKDVYLFYEIGDRQYIYL